MREDWVTTDVAAAELNVTRWAVLKAIRDKRLASVKEGRDHFIAREELDRFKRERRGRGRPRTISYDQPVLRLRRCADASASYSIDTPPPDRP
jgi:excisionase family DNA binding protein